MKAPYVGESNAYYAAYSSGLTVYTRRPRVVRAIMWDGENFDAIENFVGAARCAAYHPATGRLYIYAADGLARVMKYGILYIDEWRELHVMSPIRFGEEFREGGVWPVPHAPNPA